MHRILIPDYLGQQVISGIRGLQPNVVDVADKKDRLTFLAKSRYINNFHNIVPPNIDEALFLQQLMQILSDYNYDLVLPFGLVSYYVCSKYQDKIKQRSNLFLPDYNNLEVANDKRKSAKLCQDAGIDYPLFYEVSNRDDLKQIAGNIKFPVVIKARSCSGTEKGLRYARNREELYAKYDEIESHGMSCAYDYTNPLVQEFIPGYIHDACTLSLKGVPLYILTQVRALMYPVYGGVGAINITTENSELKRIAQKTIEVFCWNGPAQIEFKYDPRDKKYKFIELNPKLWGTLDLSIKAGFNFPQLVLDYVTEGKVYDNLDYKKNLKYIFRYSQELYAKNQLKSIGRMDLYPTKERGEIVVKDFCIKDPIPDLNRAFWSYINLYKGLINNNTSNVTMDEVLGYV
jgi:predicted ATP-grasp superfamily ATP-dependent carboligase